MIAGRYTLEREIGRGGMGAVWLGLDEVLGRPVALKRVGMSPGGSTPDLARAEREARLAARLNHPHVVAIFDLVTEGDEQWLVMEHIEGTTLGELVRRDGALLPDQAAPLLRQAADALAAAHAAGIVHRDVKPSNMLVTPAGQVKLSDFGIARAEADASLTQTGLVTGSPAYLSPEVASGESATPASDVWSLGATTFHALAGQAPYDVGDNVLGALYRIVHEEPPRLPNAGWLAPLLRATMARDPAERWSMAQVRDFLAAGPSAPVHVPPPAQPDPERTRVLERPPPPPPPPPVRAAAPTAAPAGSGPRHARHHLAAPVLAAAAFLLALVLIAWVALSGDDGGSGARDTGTGARSRPAGSSQPSAPSSEPSSSPPASQSTAEPVTADGMEGFVEDYLATVTSDPRAAWNLLTPEFQAASGGFGQYQRFWKDITVADLLTSRPDPATRTISYDVEYQHEDGTKTSSQVTLRLQGDDGDYLIAAEA